jgi:cytochrome c556
MKLIMMLVGMLIFVALTFNASAADENNTMEQTKHLHQMHSTTDKRMSPNLPPKQKQHQLSNMRGHVEAVQSIVGLLAEGDFEKASQIAHSELGMTDEMKKMCNKFDNEGFKSIGMAFHQSGDDLGDVLQTKDLNKSLRALHKTMGYCVQCHAIFRQ